MLHSSNPSWARLYLIVGFSFSNPFFTPFMSRLALLPCHFVTPAVLLFGLCLLGLFWACCMFSLCLIPVARYYHWASIHAILGFLDQFHCFRASLAHFISLGILDPFQFFILMGFCLVFSAFPTQIIISFTLGHIGFSTNSLLT